MSVFYTLAMSISLLRFPMELLSSIELGDSVLSVTFM